jgi:hypothetical protein
MTSCSLMDRAMLARLRATLRDRAPEVFASELAGRFMQLRSAHMVDGRVLPAEEANALHAALTALAAEALPSLAARDPHAALDVVENAGLSDHRAGVEQALIARLPHLGPMLEVFSARAPARSYLVTTWFAELSAATGRLRDHSVDELLQATGELLERWATKGEGSRRWHFERAGSAEVWRLLLCIALCRQLAAPDGVRWVLSFDYKDTDAWEELSAMIGVTKDERYWADFRAFGDRARERSSTVEVNDLADFCNARAHALGKELRLFSISTHGDEHLFVALSPTACKAAVERGLLEVTPYLSRIPLTSTKPAGLLARLPRWLAGALGLSSLLVLAC